jgi:uncharacterized OB-fold protein
MSNAAPAMPAIGTYIDSHEFWAAIAERKLKLQYCRDAGRFQHYPRPVSVYTGRRNLEWREVSGLGATYAVTVMRVPGLGYAGTPPYCVATVELDEGVRIIARILNVPPDTVQAGMRVRLTWESIGEGAYPAFEPLVPTA